MIFIAKILLGSRTHIHILELIAVSSFFPKPFTFHERKEVIWSLGLFTDIIQVINRILYTLELLYQTFSTVI